MAAGNISLSGITQYHSCHVFFVTKQVVAPDLYSFMSFPVEILARALTILRGLLWFSSVPPDMDRKDSSLNRATTTSYLFHLIIYNWIDWF